MPFYGMVQKLILKRTKSARCQWLMPVILATQEAESRKVMI
jgi:hypothetical protein